MPVILLPGMGADHRVFAPQLDAFPTAIVPDWLDPEPDEPLESYARRMAAAIDPGTEVVLGGMSFGGMVAQAMVPHLRVRSVLLFATVRSPAELPPRVLHARRYMRSPRRWAVRSVQCVAAGLHWGGALWPLAGRTLLEQVRDADPAFLQWALPAMYGWRGEPHSAPVHHLHGANDRLLPPEYTRPDHLVDGAGHLVTLTHAESVIAWMRNRL